MSRLVVLGADGNLRVVGADGAGLVSLTDERPGEDARSGCADPNRCA